MKYKVFTEADMFQIASESIDAFLEWRNKGRNEADSKRKALNDIEERLDMMVRSRMEKGDNE